MKGGHQATQDLQLPSVHEDYWIDWCFIFHPTSSKPSLLLLLLLGVTTHPIADGTGLRCLLVSSGTGLVDS